ncbi:two-component sensor histidine kinase [Flavobacterium cyanobacteriorum]|uniref:histidine kinase n=1 Tax=Flavobacterium cyanobacteriorum TaxID=2022802 RepID=A0A255Z8T2_9FLAO|nr:HAMP domain-containing sensor histidine kinase [Flavobacterium cyanobacteriorum]OYQ37314.1 two-component sensor histidine kinase [Flavobacterium cyanobacteriorum]
MNKTRFRLLVFFMSLSLIGIILVQLYWVNSSLKNNDEQFRYHMQRILGKVSVRLQEQEAREFYELYNKYRDSTGQEPYQEDLLRYYRSRVQGAEDVIYGSSPEQEDYSSMFFEKASAEKIEDIIGSKAVRALGRTKDSTSRRVWDYDYAKRLHFDNLFKQYRDFRPIEDRVTKETLSQMLNAELRQNDVNIPYEFAVYNQGLPTKIKSDNFRWDPKITYESSFLAEERESRFRLLVSFPEKQQYLFSSILGITSLSIVFTLIIIIAYLSAINQLIKQKQISEIKTDFINNMTHEFKTPIATINLALDAIKNPKIFEDSEKVQRYLQMIRDENKRMHAQVENVLQISKLDKKELEITKEPTDANTIIEDAVEHVHLIIEARHGSLTRHLDAERTTGLLNDVHFTNVLVNILDNAIKYSPDEPVIDIYTENIKDFMLIKIKDRGLGMSKNTQKRIFEKFYREHTGDIHNVKGHGLGLAYVKRILDDHNCQIYVESEKGKGSTFIIKMPLIN